MHKIIIIQTVAMYLPLITRTDLDLHKMGVF